MVISRVLRSTAAIFGVVAILASQTCVSAWAIEEPFPDASWPVPADGKPAPEPPGNKPLSDCRVATVFPGSDFKAVIPSLASLNLPEAWRYSRGDGQVVAVLDTGTRPHPRLPGIIDGGDYVMGGSGFDDCDAHGTLTAGLIAAQPSPDDSFSGVAPGAKIIAIRINSELYGPVGGRDPNPKDPNKTETAGNVRIMALGIVHAANMGATIINISAFACIPVSRPIDQATLGGALRYATLEKRALVVGAAGNLMQDCASQNPLYSPSRPGDPRNWEGVTTISSPCWFSEYVLCVGALGEDGTAALTVGGQAMTLAGPWVKVAAPGTNMVSLDPNGPGLVNAIPGQNKLDAINGTSFAAPVVSGVAALVRARMPDLTPRQVMRRIVETASNPARGNDNLVGAGAVNPVGALTWGNLSDGDPLPKYAMGKPVPPPQAEPAKDYQPMIRSLSVVGTAVVIVAVVAVRRWRRHGA